MCLCRVFFFRKMGEVADQKVVDEAIAKFEGTLEGYERILSKQKYIAGDVRSTPTQILI